MPEYLSKEWLEHGKKLINSDEEFQKIARNFSASFLHVVLNPPGGKPLDYVSIFENGKCIDVFHGRIENPTFKITATYDDWLSIHLGKVNFINLVLQGRLLFEGELDATIDYNHLIMAMMNMFPKIPTRI